MTIDALLTDLYNQNGNAWPTAALSRYVELAAKIALGANDQDSQSQFFLLRDWLHSTIAAGVAFNQFE